MKGGVGETLESPAQGWHGAGWAASSFLQTSDPTPPHSTVFLVDWVLLLDGHTRTSLLSFLHPFRNPGLGLLDKTQDAPFRCNFR